jgi:hypothetical protein
MKRSRYLLVIILTTLLPIISYGQEKWDIEAGTGMTVVRKDASVNGYFGIAYRVTNNMDLNLSSIFAAPHINSSTRYNFYQVSFDAEYLFLPESNNSISSIMGFSYIHFDKNDKVDENNGIGLNLGVRVIFNNLKKFNYGFRIVNTYSSISYGGILSTNVFFRYNF